ncbi:sulfur carrier protein ThiS [Pseudomonas aeruginosa]
MTPGWKGLRGRWKGSGARPSRRRVAVELNLDIVPRSQHASTALKDGDRVEIGHAIGGG